MLGSNFETAVKSTKLGNTVWLFELDDTNNCGDCVQALDLVSFPQVFYLSFRPICHSNKGFSGEATSIEVPVVVNLRKRLIGGYFNCLFSLPRWLRWIHIVVYIVSLISKVFEHVTAEMSHSRVSEIILDLLIESSSKLPELVDAPLLHVLFLDQRLCNLLIKVSHNTLGNLIVQGFEFFFEFIQNLRVFVHRLLPVIIV